MKKHLPDADETIQSFRTEVAKAAFARGWALGHMVGDGSERTFFFVHGGTSGARVEFFAKLSQSDRGWWGVMFAKGADLVQRGVPLILLTAAVRGYFIRPKLVHPLLKRVSKSDVQYEINERDVRSSPFFTSADKLITLLLPAGAAPPSPGGPVPPGPTGPASDASCRYRGGCYAERRLIGGRRRWAV